MLRVDAGGGFAPLALAPVARRYWQSKAMAWR